MRRCKMKKYFFGTLLFLLSLLLIGCASKEAKQFKNNKEVQAEIEETIKAIGKDEFALDLDPNAKKMKFGRQNGIPLVDDKTLIVPVETTGKPVYSFDVTIHIRKQQDGTLQVGEVEMRNLDQLGNFLLEDLYAKKFKKPLKQLEKVDPDLSIYTIRIDSLTAIHYDDEDELEQYRKALAEDYNAGNFTKPDQFITLIDKHRLKEDLSIDGIYLPEVSIRVKRPENAKIDSEEKVQKIIQYIEESHDLPLGDYSVSMPSDKNHTSIYETVRKQEWPQ